MGKIRQKRIISRFKDKSILVIGDVMLDQWVWGKVSRISPEAPVPVVQVEYNTFTPGGAANVASNLSALGVKTYLMGVVGNDEAGDRLKSELEKKGIDTRCILADPSRPTTQKTRIIAHHQQVCRTDLENKTPIGSEVVASFVKILENDLEEIDGIIVSDYFKGMITGKFMEVLIKKAARKKIPIIGGPKPQNIFLFKGVSFVALNEKEAREAATIAGEEKEAFLLAGERILGELRCRGVLITRGERGMSFFDGKGEIFHVPALATEVFDVSGAGDTVISVFSLAYLAGAEAKEAIELSNYAAAVVVRKLGTATLDSRELIDAVERW